MYLISQGNAFQIDDQYTSYSPYLSVLKSTKNHIATQDIEGIQYYMLDDLDMDPIHIEAYLRFLRGEEFKMDQNTAHLFDYMGHHNELEYPIDFWKVKLEDTWIRDNFYKYELDLDPLYGLVKLDLKEPVKSIGIENYSNWYRAGGSILYDAKITNASLDFDYFTTQHDPVERKFDIAEALAKNRPALYKRLESSDGDEDEFSDVERLEFDYGVLATANAIVNGNNQYILRVYKSPSEIVHGFDVGCCGVIAINGEVYATKRAKYCIDNRVNWFEPDRSSPSYLYRLAKYHDRGFGIKLPLIDKVVTLGSIAKFLNSYRYPHQLRDFHPISAIILRSILNLPIAINAVSDYAEPKQAEDVAFTSLVWKQQDPMEQVSSTFYPKPIAGNLLEWYNSAPSLLPWKK